MCGIIGFIGYLDGFDYVFNGLKMLLNRGYDSCGCAGIVDGKLVVRKYASSGDNISIDQLRAHHDDFKGCSVMCMHSRWATTGGITDANAHPHVDYKNRIALVHNGIIENYYELRQELQNEHKIEFKSQTDTEVIVNLISVCYDKNGNKMEEAIVEATNRLHGTWALIIMNLDKPENLYCARHGSPLLIGFGGNFMMLTSEQSGFAGHVKNYVCLNDGDVVVLNKRDGKVDFEKKYKYEMRDVTVKELVLTPDPYVHWTIKEIYEQYQSSARAINFGGRLLDDNKVKLGGLDEHKDILLKTDHLIILGCGTSYHAALRGVQMFKELADLHTVQAMDAGEFTERDIPGRGKTTLILLSQSGETLDVYRCIKIAKERNLFTIGIVNVVDSLIAREVNCGCYLNAGREVAVASTKAFTSQVIVLSLAAMWFSQNKFTNELRRKEYITELRRLPYDIKKTIQDVEEPCKRIAKFLLDKHSCFVLGKGPLEPFAKEGALKIKEIGYIHSEGYSAVALKHGPFSLLQQNTPVIILNPDDENHTRVNSTIDEVRSRLAPVILVTDKKPDKINYEYLLTVQKNNTYRGILCNIPAQLIAYYLALSKGHNPDMPRNLAKTVSVD